MVNYQCFIVETDGRCCSGGGYDGRPSVSVKVMSRAELEKLLKDDFNVKDDNINHVIDDVEEVELSGDCACIKHLQFEILKDGQQGFKFRF